MSSGLTATGLTRLHDTLARHVERAMLPELADRRVLVSLEADLDETVKANRQISVEDLLTFRLGFGAILVPPDTYPIQTAERACSESCSSVPREWVSKPS